jgi:hypothetical protein
MTINHSSGESTMQTFEIKRLSGTVLFSGEFASMRGCVEAAVRAGAVFTEADLPGADLYWADLPGANMRGAYMRGANLCAANLTGADLAGADLTGANLRGTNLTGADLAGTNLAGADLYGTNLTEAKNAGLAIARTRILPEGDLIGWKKCESNVLVKLRIPADAKRSHAFGRKCRAEYVDVLEVIGANYGLTCGHGPDTEYHPGQRVTPDGFDDNWQNECRRGIHFFITRAEAEAWDV